MMMLMSQVLQKYFLLYCQAQSTNPEDLDSKDFDFS